MRRSLVQLGYVADVFEKRTLFLYISAESILGYSLLWSALTAVTKVVSGGYLWLCNTAASGSNCCVHFKIKNVLTPLTIINLEKSPSVSGKK